MNALIDTIQTGNVQHRGAYTDQTPHTCTRPVVAARHPHHAGTGVEMVGIETAAKWMGVTQPAAHEVVRAGLLRGVWLRDSVAGGRRDGRPRQEIRLWVYTAELVDLCDRATDPRQPDPLTPFRASGRDAGTCQGQTRVRPDPPVLYGLLTAADAAELDRRKKLIGLLKLGAA